MVLVVVIGGSPVRFVFVVGIVGYTGYSFVDQLAVTTGKNVENR